MDEPKAKVPDPQSESRPPDSPTSGAIQCLRPYQRSEESSATPTKTASSSTVST